MLSVVVPTMWQFDPFCDFLEDLVQLPIIDEVIVINNLVELTPDHSALKHPKVQMHNMPENIYCNPSWNLGARLAKNEKICFLSDDVIVDLKIFKRVHDHMMPDHGITGIRITKEVYDLHFPNHDKIKDLNKLLVTGDLKIRPWVGIEYNLGWGALFFINKSNWIDIHPELLIMYGDSWVFNMQLEMGRMNYLVEDCFFYTPWNMTWKSDYVKNKVELIAKESHEFYMKCQTETLTKMRS
jgi:hypothetical protein